MRSCFTRASSSAFTSAFLNRELGESCGVVSTSASADVVLTFGSISVISNYSLYKTDCQEPLSAACLAIQYASAMSERGDFANDAVLAVRGKNTGHQAFACGYSSRKA